MIVNLPNLLTISRIVFLPLFIGAFYLDGPIANWGTLTIFVAAGITDFLDGYFARAWKQQSNFGRFLDPIADKLLIAAAIVMLVAFDRIHGLTVRAALVILCREILVSGLREFLAEIRVSVPVSRLAKWKTAIQITAIGCLLLGDAVPALPFDELGVVGIWVAAVLTLITGYDYFRSGLRHFSEEGPKGNAAPEPAKEDRAGENGASDLKPLRK
ncbi:MAG: CDP-diacylglycerol--glycerol-3-phosphate 3-phosphatidyltransferase [Alphaproteobacteria bacterium]|nr:CDP-diacylglycerol--glycerol-3-phosphate 3-phosphatidyltransferase [Alphaproteobacteria bacterium]